MVYKFLIDRNRLILGVAALAVAGVLLFVAGYLVRTGQESRGVALSPAGSAPPGSPQSLPASAAAEGVGAAGTGGAGPGARSSDASGAGSSGGAPTSGAPSAGAPSAEAPTSGAPTSSAPTSSAATVAPAGGSAAAPPQAQYHVQLGAFLVEQNAKDLLATLTDQGIAAKVVSETNSAQMTVFKVVSARTFATRQEAERESSRVSSATGADTWVPEPAAAAPQDEGAGQADA